MAKVHPNPSANTCSDESTSGREIFTIWMKSLVYHGRGCTVFNSKGEVAFRVDNYQQRCSRKVFLMDSIGNVLFSLNRKKLGFFGYWEGFKLIDSDVRMEKAWFQVRRNHRILSKDMCCQVSHKESKKYYKMMGQQGKSTLKITDFVGQVVAEVSSKQSSQGVPLGDDVFTLTLQPHLDRPLIMALCIVYGLINNKL